MIIRQNEQGQPHRWALAAFPKQNNKCPTNAWGDGHACNSLSHSLVKLPLISGLVYYIIVCYSCRKSFSLATISINLNPLLTNRWKDKGPSIISFTERSVAQRPFFLMFSFLKELLSSEGAGLQTCRNDLTILGTDRRTTYQEKQR